MANPIKPYLSTSVTLALLIGLLSVGGQWVSQRLSNEVLEDTVRQREYDKVDTLARLVEHRIKERGSHARLVALMAAGDQKMGEALLLAGSQRRTRFATLLDSLVRRGHLDALEVIGKDEVVVYRAMDPQQFGDVTQSWGVAEAMAGEPQLVSTYSPDGVVIRAIEPLRSAKGVVGVISAGIQMNSAALADMGGEVGAQLALLHHSGNTIVDNSDIAANIDPTAVTEAFQTKQPIFRYHPGVHRTSVYLPVLIVDEAYVVLAQLDSTSAYTLLANGTRRSTIAAILIVLFTVLAGLLALHFTMRPLRNLRTRAEAIARDVSDEAVEAKGRNEIAAIVGVLDSLTSRLVHRNRELVEAKTQADAANLAKSHFLSAMSHEIRTPLNGVMGLTELLQQTPMSEEQQRYTGLIAASGKSLNDLLGDILDVAKIEEGKVALEHIDFDLRQLLVELADVYREIGSTRGMLFRFDAGAMPACRVRGDPTRVRQVLSNLLSNAMKFTQRGAVTLSAEHLPAPAGDARIWWQFAVEDTGIGIAPEVQKQLFQRFRQGDMSTNRRYGGSGLGLVISRYLVELMQGHLQVHSQPGEGSRFWFTIPFAAAAATGRLVPASPPVRASHGDHSILVVEDNQVNQLVVKGMLSKLGYSVVIVENGREALDTLETQSFDLVLMDCQMPVMDGFEAVARIREIERSRGDGRALPVIALTANALAGDRDNCIAAGMTDYLSKPVTQTRLLQILERHLPSPPLADADTEPAGDAAFADDPAAVADHDLSGEKPEAINRAILETFRELDAAGSMGLAQEVFAIFQESAPAQMAQAQSAFAQQDAQDFARVAHGFKSSTANIGADILAGHWRDIEAMAKAGRLAQAGTAFGELQQEHTRVMAAVQELMEELA